MLFESIDYDPTCKYIFKFYENDSNDAQYWDTIEHFCGVYGWYVSEIQYDANCEHTNCIVFLKPLNLHNVSYLTFHHIARHKYSREIQDLIRNDPNIIAVFRSYIYEYIYAYVEQPKSKPKPTSLYTPITTISAIDEIKKLTAFKGVPFMYPTKIIFSNDMTVCIWPDGTKTFAKVSKEDRDIWDPKYGVLLCVAKKQFGKGGTARLHDIFNAVDAVFADNDTKPVINLDTKGHVVKKDKK